MKPSLLFVYVPNFYAEVERASLAKSLSGSPSDSDLEEERPLIVGGDPRKKGVVQSATPEALALGVREGMLVLDALEHCPRARVLRTNLQKAREASQWLRVKLREQFEALEPAGLDGAYLQARSDMDPLEQAERLRETIRNEQGLPLRVGIAAVKFLSKLAAEEAGSGGILRILPGEERSFLAPLPVTRLVGVGTKTEEALAGLGVDSIGDIVSIDSARLDQALGARAVSIRMMACGEDDSGVCAAPHAKSISQEFTFDLPETDLQGIDDRLQQLALQLEVRLDREQLCAGRVLLRLGYSDCETSTRSKTLRSGIVSQAQLLAVVRKLLGRTQAGVRPLRQVGIAVSSLQRREGIDRQLELFSSSN